MTNSIKAILVTVTFCPIAVAAHYDPMINDGYPVPPPVVDPGPDAALLRVTVLDAVTGNPTSATVSVNRGDHEPDHDPYRRFSLRKAANRHKGPTRFRRIPYYFYTDGRFELRVPPGHASIQVGKGYEFLPKMVTVSVGRNDTADVRIPLHRTIDMAARGWFSGDTHIHVDRTGNNDDTLLTITSAKDIRYAYLLSMNTSGYDRGGEYESWLQQKGLGDCSMAKRGPYHISSGHEYRTTNLGHVTILLTDRYVRASGDTDSTDAGPSLGIISSQARALNGFIGLNHGGYRHQEADGLLLESKMDFLELLQFGGYRSLGLKGWYDFLNIGFQLPIVGACDFPYVRELGSEITYVWSDRTPTPRTFVEAIAAGRSFATSGPMVFLTVGGRRPGDVISLPENADSTFTVDVDVSSPIYPVRYLELIVNGSVVKQHFDEKGRVRWIIQTQLSISETSWIAAELTEMQEQMRTPTRSTFMLAAFTVSITTAPAISLPGLMDR